MRRFKKILYIVASDSDNKVAFEHATTLASNNQACLTILQVIDETPATIKMNGRDFSTKEFHEKLVMEHQKKLQALVDSLEQKINSNQDPGRHILSGNHSGGSSKPA